MIYHIYKRVYILYYREVVKLDELGWEIVSIALPAALALAADPITSLVDTAFVGHLGILPFHYFLDS